MSTAQPPTHNTTPAPAPTPAPAAACPEHPLDLAGIGIGPFNLSLAALAHGVPSLRTAFYEQRPAFQWHSGLLVDGARVQVPFLGDLVTLADPASPWTFLNYLKAHERLFPFYLSERFHIERAEYEDYCRWVSHHLPSLHFGHQIDAVRWNHDHLLFEIDFTELDARGQALHMGRSYTRSLVLGVGTEPHVPAPLCPLVDAPGVPVIHSADYLQHREQLLATGHVTVVGSGQSGAEVFLDLLRNRPPGAEGLHWLTRTPAFAPMEYSKLGLEHFTPDYTRYFHALPECVRDQLLRRQWQLYKGIAHDTMTEIHDELYRRARQGGWPDAVLTPDVTVRTAGRIADARLELHLEHRQQGTRSRHTTEAVVLATGYRERRIETLIAALDPYIRRDSRERPRIDEHHRIVLDPIVKGSIYVQNAERHSHGVGAPDLGLAAWRSAVILNSLTTEPVYALPRRTAFTTFGLPPTGPGAPVIGGHLPEQRDRLAHTST
ncbi:MULTISPECIES: SidA/IucD/PvdA family monooxygenase [Streptomyces]|uniref:L-lysine N6-monooxygenase MbtG n=1 Tax=Streptomyces lonegramiae TaxID=3075524 RepID=A0ABU2XG84_9ACTN|nr:SidA/IucD/PvdA family monooxygenase [Streptomyces sp. DSM 41529]MDT0544397.1 SidA/IucD/PvdA family monooxygenase [Streptomyces sp. DSM 41529]